MQDKSIGELAQALQKAKKAFLEAREIYLALSKDKLPPNEANQLDEPETIAKNKAIADADKTCAECLMAYLEAEKTFTIESKKIPLST